MSALCAGPFAVCPLSIGKWLNNNKTKTITKTKKKQTKKPEVPQGELRTQVQSKITLQWAGVMSNLKCMMDAAKHI